MKKIGLLLLVLLCGCSTVNQENQYLEKLEASPTVEVTCEPCLVDSIESKAESDIKSLGFDPYLADNEKARAGKSVMGIETDESLYQSVLARQLYIEIVEGRLSVTDINKGERFEFQTPSNFKALAEYNDCSDYHVYALTESKEVYYIDVSYYTYNGPISAENVHYLLKPLNLEDKVSALAVKEYKNIYSTCGYFHVYAVDTYGVERSICTSYDVVQDKTTYYLGNLTSDTSYVDFVQLDNFNQDYGTPERPIEYLLLMANGTLKTAFDYNEFDLRINQDSIKNEKGKVIYASHLIHQMNNGEIDVYIIADDGKLYSFSNHNLVEIGECSYIASDVQNYEQSDMELVLTTGEIIKINGSK